MIFQRRRFSLSIGEQLILCISIIYYLYMSNNTQTLNDAVTTYAAEADKFWNGNNAAGSRARKALQEIGKYVKTERKRIQEAKNARKVAKA
jgi:uncharacterized protein (UPF0333 family)